MARQKVEIQPPLAGLDRAWAVQSQPPFSLSDANNVRGRSPFDSRAILGSRPGLVKAFPQCVCTQAAVESFTLDFAAIADTHIGGDISPIDGNYGTATSFQVGRLSAVQLPGYAPERTLLLFDLNAIPANATLTAATLQLHRVGNLNNPAAKIYRITQTGWGETTVRWKKYDGVNNWITDGGDFDLTTPSPIDWAVSADTFPTINVLSHAQDAYSVGARGKQLHMLLKLANDITSNIEYGSYHSAEFTTTPSFQPKLTVTYEVAV